MIAHTFSSTRECSLGRGQGKVGAGNRLAIKADK